MYEVFLSIFVSNHQPIYCMKICTHEIKSSWYFCFYIIFLYILFSLVTLSMIAILSIQRTCLSTLTLISLEWTPMLILPKISPKPKDCLIPFSSLRLVNQLKSNKGVLSLLLYIFYFKHYCCEFLMSHFDGIGWFVLDQSHHPTILSH